MVGQSALSQQRVRHMEAIHRHQACNRNARLGQGDRQLRRIVLFPVPGGPVNPSMRTGSPLRARSATASTMRVVIDEACVPTCASLTA